jgi:hypothetical protein
MTEVFPSTSTLEALSGLTDTLTGVYYPAKGEGLDWYASFVKCIYRLVKNITCLTGLRVVKVDDLSFGVKPGTFFDGNVLRTYAGLDSQDLTDNATNYIYLLADGTLTVNTSGFPDAATTRHLRLATITTADETFSDSDITDYRQSHLMQIAGPVSHIASAAIAAAQLTDDLAGCVPAVSIGVGTESSNAIAVTIQILNAKSRSVSGRFLINTWLSDSQYGGRTATAPSAGISCTAGGILATAEAGKHWQIVTDATGKTVLSIGEAGTHTWYLNVEIDGKVYAGGAISFS